MFFEKDSAQEADAAFKDVDISYLGLSKRVEQTLRRNDIRTVGELFVARDIGYMFVHGIGPHAAANIETAIKEITWPKLLARASEESSEQHNRDKRSCLLRTIGASVYHKSWKDVDIERIKHVLNQPIEEIALLETDRDMLLKAGCRSLKHALRLLRRGTFDDEAGFVWRLENSIAWYLEVSFRGFEAAKGRVPPKLRGALCQPSLSLVDLILALSVALSHSERESYVWQRRHDIGEKPYPTLAHLSKELKITRERVRQIETGLSERITNFMYSPSKFLKQGHLLPPPMIEMINNARLRLNEHNYLIALHQVPEILEVGIIKSSGYEHFLGFLLESFGLMKVGTVRGIGEVWSVDGAGDIELVQKALLETKKYLRNLAWPKGGYEIAAALNKEGIPMKYTKFVLDSSPEIIHVEENQYELKFDALPTLADKAYRVLARADVVMHATDILSNIKSSDTEDEVQLDSRYLGNRLAADDRFRRGGRSGEWGLATWPIERKTIPQLVHRLFTEKGPVIPIAEAEELLRTWRPDVTPQYISNYLRRADLFYIDDAKGIRQIEPSRIKRRNVQKPRSEHIQAEFIRAVEQRTQDAVENDDGSFTLSLHDPFVPPIRVYLFELRAPVLNGNTQEYRHQLTQGSTGRREPCYFLSEDSAFPLLVGYVDEYSAFVFWDAYLHNGKRYAYTITVSERTVVFSLSGHVAEQQRSLRAGIEETVLVAHRSRVREAIRRRWELTLNRLTA